MKRFILTSISTIPLLAYAVAQPHPYHNSDGGDLEGRPLCVDNGSVGGAPIGSPLAIICSCLVLVRA